MNIQKMNDHLLYVHAVPWEKLAYGELFHPEMVRGELLIGEVLVEPNTRDEYTRENVHIGDRVLIRAYDNAQDAVYVYPVEGQKLMEEGKYVVSETGLIGVYIEN